MCGVPIFSLACKPFQNTELLSWTLPDPRRFPPAVCWADGGGGWLRISWESEHGVVSSQDIPHPCVSLVKSWKGLESLQQETQQEPLQNCYSQTSADTELKVLEALLCSGSCFIAMIPMSHSPIIVFFSGLFLAISL